MTRAPRKKMTSPTSRAAIEGYVEEALLGCHVGQTRLIGDR